MGRGGVTTERYIGAKKKHQSQDRGEREPKAGLTVPNKPSTQKEGRGYVATGSCSRYHPTTLMKEKLNMANPRGKKNAFE